MSTNTGDDKQNDGATYRAVPACGRSAPLDSLPNELLDFIIGNLGRNSRNQLCLVSKRFAHKVRLLRLEKLTIDCDYRLEKVYHSLHENPDLGVYIRSLKLTFSSGRSYPYNKSEKSLARLRKDLEEQIRHPTYRPGHNLVAVMIFQILSRTPRLENLVMRVDLRSLGDDLVQVNETLFRRIENASYEAQQHSGSSFLPALQSLTLSYRLIELQEEKCLGLFHGFLDPGILSSFSGLPQLRTLTLHDDTSDWLGPALQFSSYGKQCQSFVRVDILPSSDFIYVSSRN
ncbi:hypothetical protein N0V82_006120 [Gnomoniopsis sp. IMI 355080]|nr:hypothetical protein N0V82_006120 [Gnomoniopsis sp. IMI 355080]